MTMEQLPFELMYLLLKMIIQIYLLYHLGNSFFIYYLDSFG